MYTSSLADLTISPHSFSMVEHALGIASLGFPVFPIWEEIEGQCSCGNPVCGSPAKHPRLRNGLKGATLDAQTIKRWWKGWPEANIGIATGNGLLVVDIDGPDGEAALADLHVPDTLSVRTGRGRHLWFSGKGTSRRGTFPGVDVRGEGGYVLAPPSRHISGAIYAWEHAERPLAQAPGWAQKASQRRSCKPNRSRDRCERDALVEGERNDRLFRRGCAMRGFGMSIGEIGAALLATNQERCDPPLDEREVCTIAASIERYEPGDRVERPNIERLLPVALTLGPQCLAVYVALVAHANQQGVCWPSYDTIAEVTGIARRCIAPCIQALEGILIDVERRPPESNRYTLTTPPTQNDEEKD